MIACPNSVIPLLLPRETASCCKEVATRASPKSIIFTLKPDSVCLNNKLAGFKSR
ncbi:hypothetical protein THIOM_000157 [Candidatus Thiomargarita nelsonii]|uniref:Uncharacterized protein n=1 Tax=Candidatus Thiomargarita nelsonii TaxID=1003181 RepID=A0A176S7U4_9GAMM|nr:hypothetical protein THIOM_000157 [Candidatus Thiomargarita nelsonii]